jgi:hypothetical protein
VNLFVWAKTQAKKAQELIANQVVYVEAIKMMVNIFDLV